jgi:hypothetical protein
MGRAARLKLIILMQKDEGCYELRQADSGRARTASDGSTSRPARLPVTRAGGAEAPTEEGISGRLAILQFGGNELCLATPMAASAAVAEPSHPARA